MSKYEISKLLKIGFFFKPLIVPMKGESLAKANFRPEEELIVIERKGQYRAFLAREMAYHHIAQGEIAGEPYLVTF
jgi:Protein of unknown function (DUF3179)